MYRGLKTGLIIPGVKPIEFEGVRGQKGYNYKPCVSLLFYNSFLSPERNTDFDDICYAECFHFGVVFLFIDLCESFVCERP